MRASKDADLPAVGPDDGVEIKLELRGGHTFSSILEPESLALKQLRRFNSRSAHAARDVIQMPLAGGREALSFCSADILRLQFPRAGEHPTMNVSEGHLGGYISARHPRSAEMGTQHGDPATWTPDLWRWMHSELQISSVLDVGCGEGHTAEFFRALGCRVCGVDGSELAERDSVLGKDHSRHDYSEGPFVPDASFDLVWSCEFVEHVEEAYLEHFLATFNCARRFLFITAAPPGQPGWHHVNCRLPQYWIEHIQRLGFYYDVGLTERARALAGQGHFARQGMAFVRPA
ncbi:MAG: class I SAM-dependent methyltransferase [Congregibacter sp.]